MTLFVYPIKYKEPLTLFSALRHTPYSLLLDSALPDHSASRFSYIAFHPVETIESTDGVVTITNREEQLTRKGDPFAILQERLERREPAPEQRRNIPPFQGGAAGMWGYDLARGIERLPSTAAANEGVPDMAVGLYNQVISFDLEKRQAWHVIHTESEHDALILRAQVEKILENPPGIPPLVVGDSEWRSNTPGALYKHKVRRVLDYIRAGDIFQANLSQRFEAKIPDGLDSFAHYCTLRRINPAPFAAYMNFGEVKISSASPERFIRVQDRAVETRPIKGTRPRFGDPNVDQLYLNELENSEKDRAENAMIVDLLRNDLSKVCEDHSVDVPSLFGLESFASVHHLVSTVTGSLRVDRSPVDLLKACFPGGSVTGCPKVRAMEIIEELEPNRRGPYCGALGYIGFNGDMDTSIAIRTLVYNRDTISFQAGGGIVADSLPEAEYQETFDKAEAIFRSFETDRNEEDIEKEGESYGGNGDDIEKGEERHDSAHR
ncbi:MAG: aminodeoxychorismate synthase component I [Alphaproteobacteria bacterium]|nr:aminodeoxychorismate synthase component I [Alphaproteobacteria bacterium]